MESRVLKTLITSRESFNSLAPYVKESIFSEAGIIVYKTIEEFYERDKDIEHVDQDMLLKLIGHKYPKKLDLFTVLVHERR